MLQRVKSDVQLRKGKEMESKKRRRQIKGERGGEKEYLETYVCYTYTGKNLEGNSYVFPKAFAHRREIAY
jgi:hypothetical protein